MTYGGDLREFANSDISPTDIKGTLVGSDTMDLKSDEPRVVGLRIGDIIDQLAIDPGLDPFKIIWIRMQQKPLKTENNSQLRTEVLFLLL